MNNIYVNQKDTFDHGSNIEFVDYYAEKSATESNINRMKGIFDCVKRHLKIQGINQKLSIADIGCNTGMMSIICAQEGHKVYGLDVNAALLTIASQRAKEAGLEIEFFLGSATCLPWEDASMDVIICPVLLEHVVDWQDCLTEFARVLKPNGVLFMSTTNKLCPIQEEFNLPLYSWYPSVVKRYYENLSRTTRLDIVNYAKYPAVNWFSFYQLKKEFLEMDMESFDRFDIMDVSTKPKYQKIIIKLIKSNSFLRWLGHVASPVLSMLVVKQPKHI